MCYRVAKDIDQLGSLPAFERVEEIEGEASLEVQRSLIEARAAGRLPALKRAALSRNIYVSEPDEPLEDYRTQAPRFERTLGLPLERSTLTSTPEGTLVYTEFVLGPYDLLDLDKDRLELDRLDALLREIEDHPLHTLKVVSPDPVVTRRLLEWAPLGRLRDLVLVLDTFTDDDSEWPEALSVPYRVDDRDIAPLTESEALRQVDRLHLSLSFNRDDRWRKRLSSLPAIPRLYTLDLSHNELLDKDLTRLLKSSLFVGVARLSLQGNRCTNVSDLFRKDDGTFARLEYLDLTDITGYSTVGTGAMSYGLNETKTFTRLETLLLEGSAQTEFGETLDKECMGRPNLPSLAYATTSHYYFTVFE